ncbi:MAG TPA: START domain-containing protein [Turneriella sp.]|nr:START domain-containing protein [Turneriella sp.]HNL54628.1 START domain-containing protein [Turneriella sp.]HNM99607.1 START domain-containing protein [Turneriella sp.]
MRFFLQALSVALALFPVSADSPWERKLHRDGIVVDVRSVADSDFKEFKARMRVKSTLVKATEIMRDIPGYTRWMKDCKEAREVQKISASSGIVYSLQAAPWPITEREAVVRYDYRRSSTPAALYITIAAEPNALPQKSGRVRIPRLKGYWSYVEISAGELEVTYSMHSEPGGSLPGWAAAGMVAHLPYETMKRLKAELER